MILTQTTPTVRLGSGSRLLLQPKGKPHAFDEAQLTLMLRWAVRDMHSFIGCHCMPVKGSPHTYFRPQAQARVVGREVDEAIQKAFDEAFEFLCYVGMAGTAGPDTVWIRAELPKEFR